MNVGTWRIGYMTHETLMPYASEQDMINLYGTDAITIAADRDGDGEPDAGVTQRALGDASSLIDTHIGVRYELPLPETPDVLRSACVDIALYRMSASAAVATEEQRQRYEDAISLLKRIADGKASLGLKTPPPADPGRSSAWFQAPPRLMTRETLRGF